MDNYSYKYSASQSRAESYQKSGDDQKEEALEKHKEKEAVLEPMAAAILGHPFTQVVKSGLNLYRGYSSGEQSTVDDTPVSGEGGEGAGGAEGGEGEWPTETLESFENPTFVGNDANVEPMDDLGEFSEQSENIAPDVTTEGSTLTEAGTEMGEIEAAGGGPEDPVADVVAAAVGLGTLFAGLFHKKPPSQPTESFSVQYGV